MKNTDVQKQKLSQTIRIGRETYYVDLNGVVSSSSLGELGHTEDTIETAKWFHELFTLMDAIEDGLTDTPTQLP